MYRNPARVNPIATAYYNQVLQQLDRPKEVRSNRLGLTCTIIIRRYELSKTAEYAYTNTQKIKPKPYKKNSGKNSDK
ncbi:uncharacterized protein OCT59_006357 [Rhizophagus irregularis]|uniref:uncharacterized protein n=1 Tax=Rhizophagus irregularis TaxID=588596 RepID=UPI00332F4942|nr:hypothetical protein OCT59_006357 [Rhizophagus irregularis]